MVSVAAYVPVSAAVPVLSNVAMVASAEDYTSGQRVRAQNLKAGDTLSAGAVIQPYNNNSASYLTVVDNNGKTLKDEGYSNYTISNGERYRVVSVSREKYPSYSNPNSNMYWEDWKVTLEGIYTATVTLPSGLSVVGVVPDNDGTYTLEEGKNYTVYSDATLKSLNTDVVKLAVEDSDNSNWTYKYTLKVQNLSENKEVEIAHEHSLKVYSSTDGTVTNKVFLKCNGEPKYGDVTAAELDVEENYYYGDVPEMTDLKLLDPTENAALQHFGIVGAECTTFTITKPNSAQPLAKDQLEVGNKYVAHATVVLTDENGETHQQAVWQEFNYERRPLKECKVYNKIVDDEGEVSYKELAVVDGVVSIEPYEYNGNEQGPDIVIKHGNEDITKYVNVVAVNGDKARATDVGAYQYRLEAKEDTNYTDSLTVRWSISSAPAGIEITAKDNLVYDGEPLNFEDDFTVSGENAGLVKNPKSIKLTFDDGEGKNATENGFVLVEIEIPNHEKYSNRVSYKIAKRPVDLKPVADEMTYGDAAPDSVEYTVEAFDGENKRGFITSDLDKLNEGLGEGDVPYTEQDFFGKQFVVGSSTSNASVAFNYGLVKNNAGTYNFVANPKANTINAAAGASNYDIKLVTADNAAAGEQVAVFTVNKKLLTEGMFTLSGGIDNLPTFMYNGGKQWPIIEANDGQFEKNVSGSLNSLDKLTLDDIDIMGTKQAVFPCAEDNPYYVEFSAKADSNYKGSVKKAWRITENDEDFKEVRVTAKGFGYDGLTIEEHKETDGTPYLAVDAGSYPADAKLSYTYYSVGEDEELTKLEKSPTEAGNYKVEVTATKKGYKTITGSATYRIAADQINITVDSDDLSKIFGDPDPDFDVSAYEKVVVGANNGKNVEISGKLKLKDYDGTVKQGGYQFDTSDVIVTVDGKDKTSSFEVAVDKNFTVNRRALEDENIVPKSAVFALTGIATTTDGFYVVAKGADGNNTILVEGTDYELITGHLTQEEANAFSIQIEGLGNYKGYAESSIKVGEGYKVSVKSGTFATGKVTDMTEAMFAKGDTTTVKADKPADGMKFGYWTRDGRTVSYNEKYSFLVNDADTVLEAHYVENEDDITKFAQADIISAGKITKDGVERLEIRSSVNVPEGCKIKKAGIVTVKADSKPDVLDDTIEGAVKVANQEITARTYEFAWTKKDVQEGDKWYAKAYLVYEKDGVEETLYGDMVEATLNGFTVVEEKEIPATAFLSSAEFDKTLDKGKFVADLEVPSDCKIIRAGLLAATEKLTEDDFVDTNSKVQFKTNVEANETVTKHHYIFTWTKKREAQAITWYTRAYLVFEDSNGKEHKLYGDTIEEVTIPATGK